MDDKFCYCFENNFDFNINKCIFLILFLLECVKINLEIILNIY